MFRFILTALIGLCALTPAWGIIVRTYPDALSKAGDKPIVMFVYGANYDKFSMKVHEEFIKKHKIMPAVRKCVFLEVPMYQYPKPDEQKEMDKVLGKKSLPGGIWCYPCLAVVDKNGTLRGIVQGADKMKNVELASAELSKLVEAYIAQEKLLEKAASASGARKAELLLQASNINLTMPNIGGKDSKATQDMKDDIGLGARLAFDPIAIVEKLQIMSFAEADAYIRGMIASGCYSRRQRQEMMAAYAGHLRRNNASPERLRALYTEMRNLDPTSMYGAYAEGAIALWVNKETFDPSTVPVELRRSDDDVSAVASVPGSADSDTSSGKTALGSNSLEDEALEEEGEDDSPSEDDFESDEDAEGEE